jgi:transcription-repair coupling factor (superfamily II helicase)
MSPASGVLGALAARLRADNALQLALGGAATTIAAVEPATAAVVAALDLAGQRRPQLVVVPTAADAERLTHDLAAFLPSGTVELFPAWDTLPFERVSPDVGTMGLRLRVLWRLLGHEAFVADGPPRVVVAPVRAALQRLAPLDADLGPVAVTAGDQVDQAQLVDRLVTVGYRREPQVEHRGELAVRGGIVDVFPPTDDEPVRIDLFGDEVDRLVRFDPGDQRARDPVDRVVLVPCRELLPTPAVRARAAALLERSPWGAAQWQRVADGECFDGMESWLPWLDDTTDGRLLADLVDDDGRVVVVEPRRCRDRAAELLADEAALADALAETWGGAGADEPPARLHLPHERLLAGCSAPVLGVVGVADRPDVPTVEGRPWGIVPGDRDGLVGQLRTLVAGGTQVVVCADGAGSAGRIADNLRSEGLVVAEGAWWDATDGSAPPPAGAVTVVVAPLDRGVVLPGAGVALLAEADLSGRRRPHRTARARARAVDGFFDSLSPGDFVVHRQHGVARYAGMVTRTVGGSARDYLLLEYRGDDKLYLPSDQIGALTPYSGGEAPSLSRLGGSDWQRTRAKARAAVRQVAEDLVALYRRRLQVEGRAFGPDTPWQRELEESFPFLETADQLRAIDEVKADMEAPRPMDRLVCGDVGFGKTEVAVRAIFKAVQDGTQAAVLVPTTLLAQQHAQTLAERFAAFPVRVEALSRFLAPAEAKAVVAGVADGSVDVVVGTHRLLASDVSFKNLGLLVVDEEQRFGVSHKEAVKQLASGVDVLTLTASPIPRTLEMALTGIRDLSLISTPPAARQPILTYVGEYDEAAVVEAVRRELLREGQVFFVHNWVRDIEQVAARLRQLVPEARVAVAHGQMDEGSLEQVVLDFWERRFDVLVCTTIIESGIDMPSVNTLVVDRADRLGLGQLHQLRGRVGRSGQRAYAYLFHPADRTLSETAYERLRTIGEHTELGSGFKIAMRDLEIRGAGNLLGEDQSGHIAAVGYDLYVQMVAEAVAELKGEPVRPGAELTIDLPSVAHLPASYIEAEDVRLECYRRLAAVTSDADVDDIQAEWLDRFGPLPPPARGLLAVARLRAACVETGVTEVSAVPAPHRSTPGRRVLLGRLSPLRLPLSSQVRLRRLHPDAHYKDEPGELQVPIPAGEDPAVFLCGLLRQLVSRSGPATAEQHQSATAPGDPATAAGTTDHPGGDAAASRAGTARSVVASRRR